VKDAREKLERNGGKNWLRYLISSVAAWRRQSVYQYHLDWMMYHPDRVPHHPCSPGVLAKAAGPGRASTELAWLARLAPAGKCQVILEIISSLQPSHLHPSYTHLHRFQHQRQRDWWLRWSVRSSENERISAIQAAAAPSFAMSHVSTRFTASSQGGTQI